MAIKAREVRERLKGKVDPEISTILEAIAEEQYQIGMQLKEMANAMNSSFDTMNQIVEVVGVHKERLETLHMRIGGDDA